MDQRESYNKICNTVKTDLSLLLECLKCQMKCPELQKQALLTIHSICENREDNVDLLREMGGAAFVYNLSKSRIVHAEVKETALFTLGTIAEANVYCKNSLCRKETFADLAGLLMKEDNPLTHKRVSVYLLSVLVTNNKPGQTLAQTTGCLDILLDLFRTTFPLSTEATLRAANATQNYQLWASVSSALCGCVNNPQNEEGQRVCVAAFPIIKIWLEEINLTHTEIFQPICSFIAMTVANNSCVQESFSASGCLDTLSLALVRLASAADTSLLSCQLSVILAKTLSSCISDNSSLAAGLAQYGVVSHLFSLLASPHLDPEDRLSILLTLGHCTEASEEHQFQLVRCGGLPLVITLLTEDASEEVKKTATFILQTCKQATMSLGVPGLIARKGEGESEEPVVNIEAFKSSARELLRRIDLLEKRQDAEDEQEHAEPSTSTEGPGQTSLPPALPLQQKESIKTIPTAHRQTSTLKHGEAKGADNNMKLQTVSNVIDNEDDRDLKNMSSSVSMLEVKTKTSGGVVRCPVCKCTRSLKSSHLQPVEGGREPHTTDNQLFKPPAPVWHSVPKEIKRTNEEELQDREMSKVGKKPVEERSLTRIRCPGCVLSFEEVTSRNFESIQSSCHHSCDLHKALLEATEQFRRDYLNNTVGQADPDSESVSAAKPQRSWKNRTEVSLTPIRKQAGKGNSSKPDHQRKMYNGFSLIPLHGGARNTSYNKTGPSLTPLKRSRSPEERRGANKSGHRAHDEPTTSRDHCSTRRKRKDFSREEVRYLLCGVQTYGFSWNSILWSYPFQPGRTNVNLAKKYRQLMKGKAQDAGCA